MSALEAIVLSAHPHANGFAADMRRGYDVAAKQPLLTRAWWQTHPITNKRPAPVWPVKEA